MREDTIAAVATAMGEGGIGIVRISGEDALPILEKIFESKRRPENRYLTYGYIKNNFTGERIDEVMACYMAGPHSYTAEDVVEIQCHGSIVSLRKILELVLRNGARIAEPGEFTKRAFLNGRIDLSQAEAVIDLIRAKTDRTFDVALGQLEGSLSKKVREIRKKLVDVLVNITVNIDYPDEDIEVITYQNLLKDITDCRDEIRELVDTHETGRILNEGFSIAIIGKPNVGKSSLMNALLKESRAIVTDIPGTTRDTIEETLTIRNIPVRLTDTAGIHETDDVIEKIGIEKSKQSFNSADLIIFMLDASKPFEQEDREIAEIIGARKAIVILNKTDIAADGTGELCETVRKLMPEATVTKAAVTEGKGIKEIEDEIEGLVYGGKVKQSDGLMVTNVRHKALLDEALSALDDAACMVGNEEPLELLEIYVNSAYETLGRIIGETVEDDILNEVFSRFCLGK